MQELHSNVSVKVALKSASKTATGAGEIIDTQGFGSVLFAILVAAVTTADASNYFTFGVEEGDAANLSDAAAITDTDRLLGSAVVNNQSTQDDVPLKLGVTPGTKRYMRLTFTETGTAEAVFGALAILGHPRHMPVSGV